MRGKNKNVHSTTRASVTDLMGLVVPLIVATLGFSGAANAATVSITGGMATGISPFNNILGPAGITVGGGSIWVDGTLNILTDDVKIELLDVGSESGYTNRIRLGNTDGGAPLTDLDDFGSGAGAVHMPFQVVPGFVTQDAGVANIQFCRRINSSNCVFQVKNGSSNNATGASIAFAFLSASNQIVAGATNRVLIMLDDVGATDDNHDDYVGILLFTERPVPVPLPAAAWLLLSGLSGLGLVGRRRKTA